MLLIILLALAAATNNNENTNIFKSCPRNLIFDVPSPDSVQIQNCNTSTCSLKERESLHIKILFTPQYQMIMPQVRFRIVKTLGNYVPTDKVLIRKRSACGRIKNLDGKVLACDKLLKAGITYTFEDTFTRNDLNMLPSPILTEGLVVHIMDEKFMDVYQDWCVLIPVDI